MPELSFRDCKYKRKNSFRQNFPGENSGFRRQRHAQSHPAVKCRAPRRQGRGKNRHRDRFRPGHLPARNAATGTRAEIRAETPKQSGPRKEKSFGRSARSPGFTSRQFPGNIRATSGQRAPSPDNRPERPSPPVPNDGFSKCHRTGTPRPSARPDQTPGKRGRPPRRSGFHPETVPDKILRKTQISRPGRKTRSEPAPHPPRMPLEKQTPPAAGPEVSRIYPGIGLPPKPGPDQRTLNPSSARTGMGRLA